MSIKVPYQKVVNYLRSVFPLLNFPNELTYCPIELYDAYYVIINQNDVATIVLKIANDFKKWGLRYISEVFDCDDYARLFHELFTMYSRTNSCLSGGGRVDAYPMTNDSVIPIGIVLGYHAYNILIFCKKKTEELKYPAVKVDEFGEYEIYISVIEPQAVTHVSNEEDVKDIFLEPRKLNGFTLFGFEIKIDTQKYFVVYHTEKVMV